MSRQKNETVTFTREETTAERKRQKRLARLVLAAHAVALAGDFSRHGFALGTIAGTVSAVLGAANGAGARVIVEFRAAATGDVPAESPRSARGARKGKRGGKRGRKSAELPGLGSAEEAGTSAEG